MTRTTFSRSVPTSIVAAVLLLSAVLVTGIAPVIAGEEHPVVGRWSITSDAGGAVWAFQPSGALIMSGPGEIISEGTWTPGNDEHAFDAAVEVTVSGQQLEILGEVSAGGTGIALYATASDATRPDDWTPWPAESRLVGERFGMTADETPEPTEPAPDCLRPEWVEGAVDWDRCDDGVTGA